MSGSMLPLPETLCLLLMAFQGCFHAPSYANFQVLVAGWVQCGGRRTITAVALAAGAGGERPPLPPQPEGLG